MKGVLIGLGLVAAVGIALAVSGKGKKDCPVVKNTTALVKAKESQITAWAKRWNENLDGSGLDAMIELQEILFPECRWAADTVTKIERIDGSTIMWSDIASRAKGKTVAQLQDALGDLVPNPYDAGGR